MYKHAVSEDRKEMPIIRFTNGNAKVRFLSLTG